MTSETGIGFAVFETAAGVELVEAAAATCVSAISGAGAVHSSEVLSQDAEKLADSRTLLAKEGKFIDDVLEADYTKYLERKAKEGKNPKDRLDWKEARDYWLNDSPMARGNAFNKKAVDGNGITLMKLI